MRTWLALASGLLGLGAVVAAVACGTESSEFGPGDGKDGGGSSGDGSDFNNDDSGGGGNTDDGGATCKTSENRALLQPIYLGFAYDVSGSMGQLDCPYWNNDPYTKWRPVAEATEAFFQDPNSTNINASMTLFPGEAGDKATKCNALTYQTADVAMVALPSNAFTTRLKGYETDAGLPQDGGKYPSPVPVTGGGPWRGGTPTLAAVTGVLNYLRPIKNAHADARTALVLVTDGFPQGCDNDSDDIAEVATLVQTARTTDNIFTYVIGVKDPPMPNVDAGAVAPWSPHGTPAWACDGKNGWSDETKPRPAPDTLAGMNDIAQKGANRNAVFLNTGNPAQTKADLLAAINAIRANTISCELARPAPPAGQSFDPDKVNVRYDSGAKKTPLAYDSECKGSNAWRYKGTGTDVIELCPSTCDTVRADPQGVVQVEFGCVRRNIIR
jgi:hypothetical protein